ncbi:FAD-dependent oxidoreductase [Phycicoccus jejuensis]|uniref:FAD-dependent oxidoreductase n=1 Tax=Phycicoccus jejuensis TaxID=367299 RepID=UPI0004C3EE9E|nr:FAD-dependent oxidoreductase [Phycicoccus jejuensis]
MDADVVVVGAGLAGLRCADRLAEAGRAVVVVEREAVVGGRQRTDEVDGFLLDRGFQVLNPAYPAVRRWVDVDDLALRPFGAGLLVRRARGLVELAHPLREPARLAATLRSGLLDPRGLAALGRWAAPALTAPGRVKRGADRSLGEGLDAAGVSGPLRTEVLEAFLAGVVAEDRAETSEAFVRLLVRMFALGVPGLPARGIRALPEWLADRAVRRRTPVDLRLSTPVIGVRPGAEPAVECADGTSLSARAVVVAVGPEAVAGLVDVPAPVTRGLRTWWFAADEAPTRSDKVVVDGRRRGPMVNAAVVSNAVPSYAPPDAHLVEVTTLLGPGHDAAEDDVRRQAAEVFGCSTASWRTVRRDDVHDALPAQPAPLRLTSPARVADGVLVAGDHRDTASIQGALVSGHRVAGAVLDLLATA